MINILLPNKSFKALLFVLGVLVGAVVALPGNSSALSGSDFQAGHIIDDVVFTDKAAMSVQQIQDFLNGKVPTCDTYGTTSKSYYYNSSTGRVNNSADAWVTTSRATYGQRYNNWFGTTKAAAPYVCLKNYVENPTTHANNLQNPSATISGGISAAQIIWNAAQSYNINPQVLIVTLQKEQGLVTDDWPWTDQYQKAMGYACPDTSACDSTYFGFANQVTSAARQFRRYLDNPTNYNYVVGNNTIRYNPNTSCGSSIVNIQNQATAGLYDYTPYQPNAAALKNVSSSSAGGTGDSCSAYGNRNFWWYFNTWFGSSLGSYVRDSNGGVYKIEDGTKRPFPDSITFASYSITWSYVVLLSSTQLSQIPDGPAMPYNVHFRDGQLVRQSGSTGVYLVQNGTKRGFANAETFLSYGYQWTSVTSISSTELGYIPLGQDMPYNVHFRDGQLVRQSGSTGVYLVENGVKRGFPDAETFVKDGYKWEDVITITHVEFSMIPLGPDMQ
jgi:hypothetical protein